MRWPRTLFGRNVLLFVSLLVACQIAWLTLFRVMVQTPRLERLANYILEQDNLLQTMLARIPADERPQALNELVARGNPLARPRLLPAVEAPAEFAMPPGRSLALLLAPLRRALGPQHPLYWQRGSERQAWIKTRLDGHDYWMGFTTAGLVPSTGRLLAAGSLVTLLLSLLGALLIQRHLRKPLNRLTEAAATLARGETPQPIATTGPLEIAAVATSFNQMTQNLARAEQERILMLAGVSHDLRTPLSKLRLCIEMLRSGADPTLIDSMIRSIDNADAVIGQFIDFARIGSNETPQWCDPAELATSIAQEHVGKDDCRVTLDLNPAEPLLIRPVALRRAIANLVENACRYAGGEITLRMETTGDRVIFSILDRGPGVPEAKLDDIRRPFARLTPAGTTQSGTGAGAGAGLGLAIVDRITALHRGRLVLQNRDGGGLVAALELPRPEAEH